MSSRFSDDSGGSDSGGRNPARKPSAGSTSSSSSASGSQRVSHSANSAQCETSGTSSAAEDALLEAALLEAIECEIRAIHRSLGVIAEEYESRLKIKEGNGVHFGTWVKPASDDDRTQTSRRLQRLLARLQELGPRYQGIEYGGIGIRRCRMPDGNYRISFDVTATDRFERS